MILEFMGNKYYKIAEYEAEVNDYKLSLIHCDWCGERIFDDDKYYVIDSQNICKDCIDECAR